MKTLEQNLIIPEWAGQKQISIPRLKEIIDELCEKNPVIKQDNGIITEVFHGIYAVDEQIKHGLKYSPDMKPEHKRTTQGLHLLIKVENYCGEPFICYQNRTDITKLLRQFGVTQSDELLGKHVIAYLHQGTDLLGCIGILPSDGQKRHYNMSIDGYIHDLGWP